MMKDSESAGAKRVMEALTHMKKIDVAELEPRPRDGLILDTFVSVC